VYAQVMSAKTGNALGIPKDMTRKISKGYAHVLIFDSKSPPKRGQAVQVSVLKFVSLGKAQADNPICVARFSISGSTLDRITEKCSLTANDLHLKPFAPSKLEMFSHLDCNGNPKYQTMFARGDPPRVHPAIQLFDLKTRSNVDMEYGPDLILCRTPSPAGFIPSSLREQGEHCDGNLYHAMVSRCSRALSRIASCSTYDRQSHGEHYVIFHKTERIKSAKWNWLHKIAPTT
jgi:hypothetical protein